VRLDAEGPDARNGSNPTARLMLTILVVGLPDLLSTANAPSHPRTKGTAVAIKALVCCLLLTYAPSSLLKAANLPGPT
jgi:hypothetical protein